jgi:hypothetical protein
LNAAILYNVQRTFSLPVKSPEPEADHSSPSSVEVKNSILFLLLTDLHGVVHIKHRHKFALALRKEAHRRTAVVT